MALSSKPNTNYSKPSACGTKPSLATGLHPSRSTAGAGPQSPDGRRTASGCTGERWGFRLRN